MKLKKTCTGWLSPAGGGAGGGVLLRGGRSFLLQLICVAVLLASGLLGNSGASAAVDYPPLAGVQGVEYVPASADQGGIDAYTKLMLHADGLDQGTSFTDSETNKIVSVPTSPGLEPPIAQIAQIKISIICEIL